MKAIKEVRAAQTLLNEAQASGHPVLVRLAMRDLKRAYAALAALGACLALCGNARAAEPAMVMPELVIKAEPKVRCTVRPLEQQGPGNVTMCENVKRGGK